jgi:MFS family permease
MKRECRRSYVLASGQLLRAVLTVQISNPTLELTGVSQLVALLCAPLFGYLSDRYRRFNIPLLVSSLVGVLGYVGFALLKSPEPSNKNGNGGSPFVFFLAAMIGISQIGAIVCSLGLLGRGVLGERGGYIMSSQLDAQSTNVGEPPHSYNYGSVENLSHSHGAPEHSVVDEDQTRESATLLNKPPTKSHSHLKGSIAGVYSLAGGAGILLLTKLGGYLFDNLSRGAPFYMLAIFNGVLFVVGVSCGVLEEVYQHR